MTNAQLLFAVGLPLLFNTTIAGFLVAFFNKRIDDVRADIRELRTDLTTLTGIVYEMRGQHNGR